MLRILALLHPSSVGALVPTCRAVWKNIKKFLPILRDKAAGGQYADIELELAEAAIAVALALSEVSGTGKASGEEATLSAAPLEWRSALETLSNLEQSMHTEMRYVYWPDWEQKPGKLVARKGTWLKRTTQFSWALTNDEKHYLPHGILMPVLQVDKVVDDDELHRHEWVQQHARVWLKPSIVRTLEARRNAWFVYWPHFEDAGLDIVALVNTWLKRSTQMSGDLQPFELIYVPKGLVVRLAERASLVDEEWEKSRHPHVHLHRKITLAAPPLTITQDKYEIFVGQSDDHARSSIERPLNR